MAARVLETLGADPQKIRSSVGPAPQYPLLLPPHSKVPTIRTQCAQLSIMVIAIFYRYADLLLMGPGVN